jgi:hypothetical protein
VNARRIRPTVSLVDIAASTASRHILNYTARRSRTVYISTPPPELPVHDPDDPRERPAGFGSGWLIAQQRLTARRQGDRSRTGMLRALTDNVAAIHAWRIR